MSISFKNKILIILFFTIILLLLLETKVSAAISGCLSSNAPPTLKISTVDDKLANATVDIKDPVEITYYKIYWKNSSGDFVDCPTKFYKVKKISDQQIRVTFLHSGMAGGTNEFRIVAKDQNSVPAGRTFKFAGKTKTQSDGSTIKYYALDCFPRITDLKFDESTSKLSFKVTDNGASTTILVKDLYNNKKQITKVQSTSVTKTVSFNVNSLKINNSGYFYIQIYAKDKNGEVNNMYFKFKCKPTGKLIAKLVQNFKGCSYVYGKEGPTSFDCSGLTRYVYKQFGINIAHSSSSQRSYGTGYSAGNVKAGDILCFDGHVGIYIGGGKMVHAANSSVGVVETSFASGSYYYNKLITARRLVNYI